MRVGIFGGSFDPVHFGHLILAEYCRAECALDRVLFVPACSAPHKTNQQHAGAQHRVEMLRLAVAGHSPFDVSEIEIQRGGLSYTVETLRQIKSEHSDWELFLLLGADSLAELPTWREPVAICHLATLVAVGRPGSAEIDVAKLKSKLPDGANCDVKLHKLQMPLLGISSTELRNRVANRQSIQFQTPRAVEMYIDANGLYSS